MSFILDALKKSESDRQRQTGPALFEVKIAPPKARFPVWAVAIAVLLGVNMIIVGWLLLRRPAHGDVTGATAPAQNNTLAPLNGMPQPAGQQSSANLAQGPSSPPPGPAQPAPPPQNAQPPSQPPGALQGSGISDRDIHEPTLAGNMKAAGGAADGTNDAGSSPDDYAPAAEPGSSPLFKGHIRRGTESGLPLYQDAAIAPGANIPQLRLDLHVYAAKPQDRFALINMHKLHEGDSTPDGVRVETITQDGVIMSHNGSKFLLPRD